MSKADEFNVALLMFSPSRSYLHCYPRLQRGCRYSGSLYVRLLKRKNQQELSTESLNLLHLSALGMGRTRV